MTFRPGKMRHSVALYNPVTTAGAEGDPDTPTLAATLRAEITFLSGRELYSAKQFDSETSHKIRLRYFAAATAKMTARDTITDIEYTVLYVDQDLNRKYTDLYVKTVGQ